MAVYAVTHSESSTPNIAPGKRYEVLSDRGDGYFEIMGDGGYELGCLWDSCAHLRGGSWTRIDEDEPITLRPGDYVSTGGMTEETYHAVARAFVAAGAEEEEYVPGDELKTWWEWFGWSDDGFGGLQYWDDADDFGDSVRQLAPAQVINATNAGSQEEDMTPCEKLGYKVGDRFVVKGGTTFTDGSVVDLYEDDGSNSPKFKLVSGHTKHNCADGEPGAFLSLGWVERAGTADPLTTALQSARDELALASEHEAQAAQHRTRHDELMQQARSMLPDGWRLVRVDKPEEDMADPANWREGDVIVCVDASGHGVSEYTKGVRYEIFERDAADGLVRVKDDDGDLQWVMNRSGFRFHSRPTT